MSYVRGNIELEIVNECELFGCEVLLLVRSSSEFSVGVAGSISIKKIKHIDY